jgi:hypothetical protein
VSDDRIRTALRSVDVPADEEAASRSWEVVRGAFESREPVHWARRHRRPLIAAAAACALLAAVLVAALTPPGQAVVDRFRDAVGKTSSKPALAHLPAPGRLLVLSQAGPWVVHEDGSKRLLGDYSDASWSPRGLYVVATDGPHLVALDPESGEARWSLTRGGSVRSPRWSGGGLDTRIAYRVGSTLHVVAGDGSPDVVLARDIAPVAPAWRPDSHVVAYAGADGRVRVVDADLGHVLWRTDRIEGITRLSFSPDGHLIVFAGGNAGLYGRHGLIRLAASDLPEAHVVLDAVPLEEGKVLYADYDRRADSTALVIGHCFAPGPCTLVGPIQVFRGPGRIDNLTLSPDGKWLVAGWPGADEFLFFHLPRFHQLEPVANVRREFAPGGAEEGAFPMIAGWAPGS